MNKEFKMLRSEINERFDQILKEIKKLWEENAEIMKQKDTLTVSIVEIIGVGELLKEKENKSKKYSEVRKEWIRKNDNKDWLINFEW